MLLWKSCAAMCRLRFMWLLCCFVICLHHVKSNSLCKPSKPPLLGVTMLVLPKKLTTKKLNQKRGFRACKRTVWQNSWLVANRAWYLYLRETKVTSYQSSHPDWSKTWRNSNFHPGKSRAYIKYLTKECPKFIHLGPTNTSKMSFWVKEKWKIISKTCMFCSQGFECHIPSSHPPIHQLRIRPWHFFRIPLLAF